MQQNLPEPQQPISNGRPCPCCDSADTSFQRRMAATTILECRRCGSAFASALPDAREAGAIYEQLYSNGGGYQAHRAEVALIARAKDQGRPIKLGWERRRFFALVQPAQGDALLEIGCGTGLFLFSAHRRGWTVRGIELSREAASLGVSEHGLPVAIGRVEDLLGTQGAAFRAIVAWEVIEHLPHPGRVFRQILGMLKPNGVFAGSVLNYARPRYRYGEDLGPCSVPPVHLNFWTPDALRRALTHVGFKNVQVVVPRFCPDLLRPLRRPALAKMKRFGAVLLGLDTPTEMFFLARKEG